MNIEKTISEQAVSDILTPMLESQDRIVTEDVAPLFDQATGLDTPPASGTVTTTIEESRSVITAIIRKAWTATLTMLGGASVLSSIAAAYTYLRNRLQGNETYGIPDRRSEISASSPLAANLALLNDRKIGGADVPDGYSIAHLLGTTNPATEITDNNEWTLTKDFTDIVGYFPNVEKITVNCDTIADGNSNDYLRITTSNSKIKELHFPRLTYYHQRYDWYQGAGCFICPNMEVFDAPNLVTISGGHSALFFADCPITTLSLPKLKTIYSRFIFGNTHLQELLIPSCTYLSTPVGLTSNWNCCDGNTALAKVVMGKVTAIGKTTFKDCTALVHLEFADGVENSITLSSWSPTLDSSNLQQFLENFRDYIALRLTDNGSGKTLTLSQAVFSAIWDANGDPQVYQDSPEMTQCCADIDSIMTTKQWEVNKAS